MHISQDSIKKTHILFEVMQLGDSRLINGVIFLFTAFEEKNIPTSAK